MRIPNSSMSILPFPKEGHKLSICIAVNFSFWRIRLHYSFSYVSCFLSEAADARMGRFQNESVAEQIYRAFTRKNSVYVSVIMIGAVIGEKMVADFVEGCWQSSNQGKFYEDIPNLGSLAEGEE